MRPGKPMREVARTAVCEQLAGIAIDLFTANGFANVTVADVAAAAGISRSTFLRYFASKEDAVLSALQPPESDDIPARLALRPPGEDVWTALRRALDGTAAHYRTSPERCRAAARLAHDHPGLCSGRLGKHDVWAQRIADALATRDDSPMKPCHLILANAALGCLTVAVDEWARSPTGDVNLDKALDEAFDCLRGL